MNIKKSTKKLLFLIAIPMLFLFTNACTPDRGSEYHYEVLPIESFELPESFVLGETYSIVVRYNRPTTCHYFSNIYWEKNLNERVVAVQSLVEQRNDCITSPVDEILFERTFNFYVTTNGSYIFKFYKGQDEEDNPIFESVEIPVED
uniref:hypothetical protein n=1 Tax=Flavobacterium sp. TaxID=239 RepID=UPI00404A0092